ncbi:MAG: CRISPR-associated endoribonuclease Cas6 [Arcobacteraceae bacterium]|jgi:CRISPR-associated endoribonuclease Cas6|nr:CRISPR-associated endoribonuclease Cas6 [Arcobacteraceae bacterium]
MRYFELECKAYIKKDISFEESFEKISKYVSYTLNSSGYGDLHKSKGYKYYVISGFYSHDKIRDSIYEVGKTYYLNIRVLDEKIADTLTLALRENINNPDFLIISATKRNIKQFFITELYSATPVVISKDNRFWTMQENGDLMTLAKQLQDNLDKKYRDFYGQKLDNSDDFIQLIEIKNKVPQNIRIHKNGKKITFFGNKFKIVPNEDEISQKLAFMALACGLGEKNSFCGGFCLARGIK